MRRPAPSGGRLRVLTWSAAALALLLLSGCPSSPRAPVAGDGAGQGGDGGVARRADPEWRRQVMVREQIEARGLRDERVLEAMRRVPRHHFVPERFQEWAYDDRPLPIAEDQTISQPYIVALMSSLADLQPGEKVLEVGTGSGYQAAVLAELGARVYSIEIVEALAEQAAGALKAAGYDEVAVRHGDGYAGWPGEAPFDAVLVTAAPPRIPQPLIDQLAVGGRMVIPVGEHGRQILKVLTRTAQGLEEETVTPVAFVPMTGQAQEQPREGERPGADVGGGEDVREEAPEE